MSNLFSARETLAESFRNRLEFIRNDEAPGGYVAIERDADNIPTRLVRNPVPVASE